MKAKVIWSYDTAEKVRIAKWAKYGGTWVVTAAPGGGFLVERVWA